MDPIDGKNDLKTIQPQLFHNGDMGSMVAIKKNNMFDPFHPQKICFSGHQPRFPWQLLHPLGLEIGEPTVVVRALPILIPDLAGGEMNC